MYCYDPKPFLYKYIVKKSFVLIVFTFDLYI